MLYKLHAYLSLIFFIPLVVVGVTGSVLVYALEVNSFLAPQVMNVEKMGERVKFDELKKIINAKFPDHEIVGWNLEVDETKTDKIWLRKYGGNEWERVYMDAFSGRITSQPEAHDRGFVGFILELHENLLLDKVGQIFMGIVGIFSCFIAIVGFVIYRNFLKNLFLLRFKKLAVFMRDGHKFIGVFTSPVFIVVALTGAWWELRFLFAPTPPNPMQKNEQIYNQNISIDELIARASKDLPSFKTYYISFPFRAGANFTLYGHRSGQNFLHSQYSSQITYDKDSSNLLEIKDINEANFKEQFFLSFRKAHFGSYNQITKFIWFLVGFAPLFLSISGFYLWIKRLNFKRRKR